MKSSVSVAFIGFWNRTLTSSSGTSTKGTASSPGRDPPGRWFSKEVSPTHPRTFNAAGTSIAPASATCPEILVWERVYTQDSLPGRLRTPSGTDGWRQAAKQWLGGVFDISIGQRGVQLSVDGGRWIPGFPTRCPGVAQSGGLQHRWSVEWSLRHLRSWRHLQWVVRRWLVVQRMYTV